MSDGEPRPVEISRRPWSLRRRVAAMTLALLALVLVVVVCVVVALSNVVDKGNETVYRWGPAVTRTDALVADLTNQETGVRGYVLTGRPEFLQPYNQYVATQQADTARLRQLLHGSPGLLRRLDLFTAAADTWHRETADPMIAAVQHSDPPMARLDAAADQARFAAVRQAGSDLAAGVASATAHSRTVRKDAIVLLSVLLAVAAALVLAGIVVIWRGLHAWVLRPVERLGRQSRQVAEGERTRGIVPDGPPEFVALGADVDQMRRQIVDELALVQAAQADLVRSNADLEQFAYVASHDLSEPLRKVANFCQLLERQYGDQLDEQAKQYIAFAVDGAKRMQVLISDLLALSRVGRTTEAFVEVDTDVVLDRVLAQLDDRIRASGAGVGRSDLPTVQGDRELLVALFDNLVGNALKYHGDDPPLIVVTARRLRDEGFWQFTVSDNGIGIDAQYSERIFSIFQRLHVREAYEGTGIGLALCRKIVEFHGGRIWLDTTAPGPGATFRFTLPERRTVSAP